MIQYQQLIDEIRSLLEADELTLSDELQRLAAEYAALCRGVNQRLRKCDDLLKRGLRAEALQIAEQEPKLLDLVNLVEFPLKQDFSDLISLYGLQRPESLSFSVVEALNEAYFDQQPLEKLLDWHRLLAVGRAPLRDRLIVLRKLASADETNPIWMEDLRALESARLREVEGEAQAAASTGDVERLKSLVAELSNGDWLSTVPAALVKRVKQRQTGTIQVHARGQLGSLKDRLDAAYTALDVVQARQLREQWLEYQKQAQLSEDDPLAEHVAPILGWLEDEDANASREAAWSRAVASIEQELDQPQPKLESLERLYDQAARTGQRLPDALEQRYRVRVDTLRLATRRRRLMIIGSAVAGVVLVGLGIGRSIQQRLEASELAGIVAAVDQLITTREFSTARDVLTKAERHSHRDPWLQAQQRLVDAERAEELHATEFSDTAEHVRNAASLAEATPALESLQSLAVTDAEKQTVVRLRDEWMGRQRQMIVERDAAARPLLGKIANTLKSLSDMEVEKLVSPGPEAQLRQADVDLKELTGLLTSASPELSRQKDVLASRITALKAAQAEQQRRQTLLNQLTASTPLQSSDPAWLRKLLAFDTAVQDYAKQFPNDSRSTAFKQPSELPWARAALKTQEQAQLWRELLPAEMSKVRDRRSEVEKLIAESPTAPDAPLLREYSNLLQRVLQREEGESGNSPGVRQELLTLFDKPIMHDLFTLRFKNGGVYYLTEARSFSKDPVSFRYLTDYDKSNLKNSLGVKYENLAIGKTFPAPHVALATTFRKRFQQVLVPKWRTTCLETLQDLLEEREMDPLLKCLLVQQVTEFAGRGDAGLAQGLQPLSKIVNNNAIDFSSPWMDPTNDNANTNRRRAAESLERITPELVAQIEPAALAYDQSLTTRLFTTRFIAGWLNRNADGDWQLETTWRPEGTHRLTLLAAGNDGTAQWQDIGRVGADGIQLNPEIAAREGKLVFAVTQPDGAAVVSSAPTRTSGMTK